MNNIRIRRARRTDARAIAHLANMLGRSIMDADGRTSADDITRYAFGPDRWCNILVAHDGADILGYALYRHFFEGFTGHRRMFLSDLAVAPETRSKGIGERLMTAVAQQALRLDCDAITWECSADNHSALAFYGRLNAGHVDNVVSLALDREKIEALAAGSDQPGGPREGRCR